MAGIDRGGSLEHPLGQPAVPDDAAAGAVGLGRDVGVGLGQVDDHLGALEEALEVAVGQIGHMGLDGRARSP